MLNEYDQPRAGRLRPVAVTLVVLGVGIAVLGGRRSMGSAADEDVRRTESRVAALRHVADLARTDRSYFVLDPEAATITLYAGPAPLRVWPVLRVAAGQRRVPIGRGARLPAWRTHLWEGPRVDPAVERHRRLIVSDSVVEPDPSGADEWIPPTPQEAIPTPPRFLVHYADGLGLEVVAEGEGVARRGPAARLARWLSGARPSNWDRYRVRVELRAEDAGELYRSFPPEAALIAILPEG